MVRRSREDDGQDSYPQKAPRGVKGKAFFPWGPQLTDSTSTSNSRILLCQRLSSISSRPSERPRRLNRGQGGATAQLAAVSEQICRDLSRHAKQSKTSVPATVARNAMAPAKRLQVGESISIPVPWLKLFLGNE